MKLSKIPDVKLDGAREASECKFNLLVLVFAKKRHPMIFGDGSLPIVIN